MKGLFSMTVLPVLGLFFGRGRKHDKQQGHTLFQVSTWAGFSDGSLDGFVSVADLKKRGNTGIGAFDRFDGEMVIHEGIVYQVDAEGKVREMPDSATVPFANMAFLNIPEDKTKNFEPIPIADLAFLKILIQKKIKNPDLPHLIGIHAVFEEILTRSIPAQKKPYPKLAEILKEQSVFEMEKISGWIVGFWLPHYFQGINVTGMHLHFISDDRSAGGHVLDFKDCLTKVWQFQEMRDFQMKLPMDIA